MTKKKFLNKLALIMAILTVISCLSLSGCKNGTQTSNIPLEHVFKGTYKDLPEDFYVETTTYIDGKIILTGNIQKEDSPYTPSIYIINPETGEGEFTKLIKKSENANLNNIIYVKSGNIWYVENEYSYDEATQISTNLSSLCKADSSGAEVSRFSLSEMFADVEDFWGINLLKIDSEENIYCAVNDNIYVIKPDGTINYNIDLNDSYVSTIVITATDDVMVSYYDSGINKTVIKKLDKTTKTFIDIPSIPDSVIQNSYSLFTGGGSYDLYYMDQSSLYGYNLTTGKVDEIMNWINSDMNSNGITGVAVISDTKLACAAMDQITRKYQLVNMSYVPPEEIVEKDNLVIAVNYLPYDLKGIIINFNKNNDKYRIQVKDYSQYNTQDDYTLSTTMLNNDIISGKVPDIITINQEMPVDSYINKGIFADLYEFIDNDPDIKREDYMKNVFDALSVDGKLYELVPSFSAYTVAGKTANVGEGPGWNMDELNAIMAGMPKGTAAFYDTTRENFIRLCCTMTREEFIDKATGICTFDSDEFKKILEFAKTLSEKGVYEDMDWDNVDEDYWNNVDLAHRDNRTILQIEYISSFDNYWTEMMGRFGEQITLIGFPNASKNGSAIYPQLEFAMAEKSKFKEGAWQFLKYFIQDEYQNTITYNWPIKLSAFDKLAEQALTPPKDKENNDGSGGVIIGGNGTARPIAEEAGSRYVSHTYYLGGKEIEIGYITKEAVDDLSTFVKSLNRVIRYDESLLKIILEETSSYFAGEKSVDETAKIIQNRAQIYVSEGR